MTVHYFSVFFFVCSFICAGSKRSAKIQSEDVPVVFLDTEEIPERACTMADGGEGVCRPIGLCVFRYETFGQSELASCVLNQEETGTCCPKKPAPSRGTGPVTLGGENTVSMPDISLNELDSAGEEGLSMVQKIDQLEIELRRKGLFIKSNTKEHFHQSLFKSPRNDVKDLGRNGLVGLEATLRLVKTFRLDSVQSQDGLPRFSLTDTIIKHTCPKSARCPPTKYRSADGSCNNLDNSAWGKAFTAFNRLLTPRYFDGISIPRVSYDGGPLPSAREVSYRTIPDIDKPSNQFSLLFMQFAEFLAHDLSATALTTATNGEGIMCCHPEIVQNEKLLHPACFSIYIPSNDPFYSKFKTNCMEFVRSLAAPRPNCNFGPREQLNQVPAFIDGSVLYGSTENQTRALRSFVGGKLKSHLSHGEELLSLMSPGNNTCPRFDAHQKCYISGDVRVNEHPFLTAMHTLWMKEHNRIANKLSRLNPGWDDEILFWESRRIVAAEIQHITYSEFLPSLLGKKVMSSYKLSLTLSGHSYDYDSSVNPSISNAFATAAFRMGHSLVQGSYNLEDGDSRTSKSHLLKDLYFRSNLPPKNAFDIILWSMATQSTQVLDKHVTKQLTNHLFQTNNESFGLDLIALNIQRGRDHGLAGYNEWRSHCGLPKVRNFEDLERIINPASARNFSRIYRSVDDIDLYPVGLAEYPLPDGNLGPTFSCIIAEQFRRLKYGDRFWFENGGLESSFTDDQLSEIRKISFARLICDNSNIDAVQIAALLRPAEWNPLESCRRGKIAKLDIAPWKNGPVWT